MAPAFAESTATAPSNKRTHSPAGCITTKFRASMKPAKVEQLSLGYFHMRERIKLKVDKTTTIISDLDAKELEEKRTGAVQAGFPSREEAGLVDEYDIIDLVYLPPPPP